MIVCCLLERTCKLKLYILINLGYKKDIDDLTSNFLFFVNFYYSEKYNSRFVPDIYDKKYIFT